MSIIVDILIWFVSVTALDFLFYTTGSVLLKVISFGTLNKPIFSFGTFNNNRKQGQKESTLAYIVGLLFYVLIITAIAWWNTKI